MDTTVDQAWRGQVRPLAVVPPELAADGIDDRLLLGGPDAEAALRERRARLDAYQRRTGATPGGRSLARLNANDTTARARGQDGS
ncbi:MAG: hypothetical protein WCI67_06660 [Chloroflexales bacterium]